MNQPQHTPAEAVQYWYDAATERREERDRLRAVVARIRQMADYWEQQLPEVIRTPAVVSALRAALEPAAAAAAQPKSRTTIVEGPQTVSHNANEPAASAVVSPPTNRAAIAERLWQVAEHNIVAEWICCDPINPKHQLCVQGDATLRMVRALLVDDPDAANPAAPLLDAVLAVLPEPADRAAGLSDVERQFLTYALDLAADQMASRGDEFGAEDQAAMETLRRLAVEAQSCRWEHPHPGYQCEPRTAVEAHGTGTQQQGDADATEADIDRMMAAGVPAQIVTRPPDTRGAGAQQQPDTEAPETQPENPARIDRLRPEFFEHASVESIDAQIRRAERQQRQWGNRLRTLTILRQARVLQKELGEWPAPVAQQPAPVETDEERADREATERDHARGDHTYCGITCETEMPTEHLRNFVIAKGYPGTGGALDELLRRARTEVAEQQPAVEAEQDDTVHACPGRWGGPNCRCFDAEPAPGEQQAAAADGEETRS